MFEYHIGSSFHSNPCLSKNCTQIPTYYALKSSGYTSSLQILYRIYANFSDNAAQRKVCEEGGEENYVEKGGEKSMLRRRRKKVFGQSLLI